MTTSEKRPTSSQFDRPSAFDGHRPPARDLLDDCVHCGFCLPTCPTYQLWGEEMDSPRGRIYLMNLAERGEIGLDGAFTEHIDACLGCLSCVTACPSGVRYDRLIEAVRPQIERHVERPRADRLFREAIFALFPYRRRLRAATLPGVLYQRLRAVPAVRRLMQRLPERLAALESLLPPVSIGGAFARLPELTPAFGERRMRVALLTGCVQDVFFHPVNEATARVLAAEGCDVLAPHGQGCCGALELHAGREEQALKRARRTIATFEGLAADVIVTNVAGCGSSMKEYGHLLADDPAWAARAAEFSGRVRDVHEVLAGLEPRAPRNPIPARVAYHDACHLGHGQGVRDEPRAVLRAIPELTVVDVPEAALCCGSAGIYNLLAPGAADELGRRKAANVLSVNPDVIATANPGCLLQLRKHLRPENRDPMNTAPDATASGSAAAEGSAGTVVPLVHPVQLLDMSINGVSMNGPSIDSIRGTRGSVRGGK